MTTQLTQAPIATTAMLIRKPVGTVFEALVDPAMTSKFWFSKGSGRLEAGQQVRWDWEMYNITVQVRVNALARNERILFEWSSGDPPTLVEWRFTPRPDNTTFVNVTESGFRGDGDAIVKQAIGSTSGFTLVLAGLKAFLEHNIMLNLVPDRFPDGVAHEG
jgi:uncharacterized protein YndB with AHSA1/START domain